MSANPWKDAWEELDHMAGPLGIFGTMDDLAKKHGIPLIATDGPIEATVSLTDALETEVLRLQTLVTFSAILVRHVAPQTRLANTMTAAVHSPEAWTCIADEATQAVAAYPRREP